MFKKTLSILLCGMMLLSALLSCGEVNESGGNTGEKSPNSVTVTDSVQDILTDADVALIRERIAELQSASHGGFDGKEINAVGVDGLSFPTEDEVTGSSESDAVYYRNRDVENAFNVKFTKTLVELPPDIQTAVQRDQSAGTRAIHLAYGGIVSTGQDIFNNGYAAPIDSYPQIELESPWWQQTLTDYYAIGDRLFFLSGDMLPEYFERPSCVLFSKKIMEDYGIDEDLYAAVRAGEWTIDKMFEIASNIPAGGSVMRYSPADGSAGINLLFGSGATVTKFDAGHIPYIEDSLSPEIMNLAVKVSAQTGNSSLSYAFDVAAGHGKLELEEMFAGDEILFLFDVASGIARLRELDVNGFGILPNPKASAEQKQYYTYTSTDGASALFIPKNEMDAEMIGVIVEAMGAYSYMHIRPTFYDKRLKSRSVYDVESKEMLDIIYSTQVYDLFDLYGGGSWAKGNGELWQELNRAVLYDPSNISGTYASLIKATQLGVKKMLKNAEKYG